MDYDGLKEVVYGFSKKDKTPYIIFFYENVLNDTKEWLSGDELTFVMADLECYNKERAKRDLYQIKITRKDI